MPMGEFGRFAGFFELQRGPASDKSNSKRYFPANSSHLEKGFFSHGPHCYPTLRWMPIHRLRRGLPSRVLLRGGEDALHPPGGVH